MDAVPAGRRVLAGVFLTHDFDPAFFEQHVLSLLFQRQYPSIYDGLNGWRYDAPAVNGIPGWPSWISNVWECPG